MRLRSAGAALAAAAIAAACAPRPAPPAPVPPPVYRPQPLPPTPLPAPPADWREGPLSPGDWSFNGQSGIYEATFASAGGPLFALRCTGGRQIVLMRPGVRAGALTIVTSFGERVLQTTGTGDQSVATLGASDPLLDQIVFSRGRFLIRAAQGGTLVLPAWPEPARVIEECRG